MTVLMVFSGLGRDGGGTKRPGKCFKWRCGAVIGSDGTCVCALLNLGSSRPRTFTNSSCRSHDPVAADQSPPLGLIVICSWWTDVSCNITLTEKSGMLEFCSELCVNVAAGKREAAVWRPVRLPTLRASLSEAFCHRRKNKKTTHRSAFSSSSLVF